jgi:hypothetical protein
MKPLALAVAAVLLAACAETDLEKRADAERAAHNQAMAARAASSTAAMSTVEAKAKPAAATPVDFEVPPHATATEQHEWLQQLVGEWTFTCTTSMDDSFRIEGTESVRSVGGLWIVSEGRAQMGGQPIQSVMSLGYDPAKQAFIGTWFDSSQTQLWSYKGALDPGRTRLTLDTEGPSFDDPGKTSRYRDSIELRDRDHKLLTSAVQNPDGSWTTFMQSEFVRAKP